MVRALQARIWPILEKLQREFRDQGLVAMGVTVGEDRAEVGEFR